MLAYQIHASIHLMLLIHQSHRETGASWSLVIHGQRQDTPWIDLFKYIDMLILIREKMKNWKRQLPGFSLI